MMLMIQNDVVNDDIHVECIVTEDSWRTIHSGLDARRTISVVPVKMPCKCYTRMSHECFE